MTNPMEHFKPLVAAFALFFAFFSPLAADQAHIDTLLQELADPSLQDWESVENEIWTEWSKSGSDSMDFLLERGKKAIENGNYDAAIEHLTALVDHAPEFAEGWNMRANAYFRAGLYGPAISDLGKTLTLNPRNFGALAGLGAILAELGHPKDALEAYRAALALNPHRPSFIEAVKRLEKETEGTAL